jgi:hypothetical protein
LRNCSKHFMAPEISLPLSQQPSTPYQTPDKSSYTTPSYFSKINLNIIHPPTSYSSDLSLSFWLPTNHLNSFLFSRLCDPFPAHFITLCVIILVIPGEEHKVGCPFLCSFTNAVISLLLGPNLLLCIFFSDNLNLYFSVALSSRTNYTD